MINKLKIQDLIRIFYQQPFKIFYVNSTDGESFVKPTGLFISLGIATSMNTFEKLRKIIESTYPETCPRLVELVSVHHDNGEFLNTITENTPEPYEITDLPSGLLNKEEAEEELEALRERIKETPTETLLLATQRLQECIDRINQGNNWEVHQIQKLEDDYRVFHKISNYKKEGDKEYRIGIYVL